MPVPPFDRFLRPVLEVLADGKTLHRNEIYEACYDLMNLSEEQRREMLASGRRPVARDRNGWALSYLSQAGLVVSPRRGNWKISQEGRDFLAAAGESIQIKDLQEIPAFVNFESRKKDKKAAPTTTVTDDGAELQTPQERIEMAHNELKTNLARQLLSAIKSMDPTRFELLIIDLMRALGYGSDFEDSGHHTGKSHDGGIDGVVHLDRLGLEKVYLQAKRYSDGSVGTKEVQAFVGALSGHKATKGVFITTSSFSKEALEFAAKAQVHLSLIDGDHLADLMIFANLGVVTRSVFDVKEVDQGFFEE